MLTAAALPSSLLQGRRCHPSSRSQNAAALLTRWAPLCPCHCCASVPRAAAAASIPQQFLLLPPFIQRPSVGAVALWTMLALPRRNPLRRGRLASGSSSAAVADFVPGIEPPQPSSKLTRCNAAAARSIPAKLDEEGIFFDPVNFLFIYFFIFYPFELIHNLSANIY